ncbi:ATP-dependent nuclease [Botrimarina hoheduenensis]|uniref:Recombination protein F n=1 Tax=Botrimarina hoheduenensis TaxID=2528000 RepID=A0A5C5W8P2_9BACT|nr:AAA family ATPase [Botrimarina hoheduenensis]TWT46391.1 recombination protein F [Botrimarina hoheduenensis]
MRLKQANIRNFRRLEDVSIDFEPGETVFVGPNNSGKTSVTDLFRLFLGDGDFAFHDFSASTLKSFNDFGEDTEADGASLPSIDLDLWFSVDPEQDYGRVSDLLPDLLGEHQEVGIRVRFALKDLDKLRDDYAARLTPTGAESPSKPISDYLCLPGVLKQHSGLEYYKLERTNEGVDDTLLAKDRCKPLLKSLIQARYVEAQRGLDDHERGGSTLLSKVFTSYYRRHLDKAEASDDANRLIDEHNAGLTVHFANVFGELLDSLQGLGVPSVNDRTPRIISALQSETALQHNATLAYVDAATEHPLPENYNGLGVKNLIFMTLRVCDHHLHWMQTKEARPACLVVFVEEPEVHLHAQAQQTFISNVWRIVEAAATKYEQSEMTPQLVVTTHSSHILDTVDFDSVRYFRRCRGVADTPDTSGMNASEVLNLKRFSPGDGEVANDDDQWTEDETRRFLQRYLRLTHCDLFFADAAVLVEGAAENLLLPLMVDKAAPALRRSYLTVLEVSGAYAHRFAGLMRFLGLPYLVITDVDSVGPVEGKKRDGAVPANTPGASTSNGALKALLGKTTIEELVALTDAQRTVQAGVCYVTYQRPSSVAERTETMHGRTFEETFVYENMTLFRKGDLSLTDDLANGLDHAAEYETVYKAVHSKSFKKTEFALNIAHTQSEWTTPEYIAEGLRWLETKLRLSGHPRSEEAGDGE